MIGRIAAALGRLLLLAYFCWSAGLYVFLGLYPSWLVQHGLAQESTGAIGIMLFLATEN